MNYLAALLALMFAAAITTAAIYRSDAIEDKAALSSLKASFASQAASALAHAQAITAKDTRQLQKQGVSAVASATTKASAIKVYYKTVYLPSLTKLDPKDEAAQCANLAIPQSVLSSLSASPGS